MNIKTKLLSALAGVFVNALVALGIGSLVVGPAFAQLSTIDQLTHTAPQRQYPDQNTHYIRSTLTFNMCTQVAAACSVKLQAALPYNAIVLRATVTTYTAFNSTTSDVVTIGTTKANGNELVSAGVTIHAQGVVAATIVANQHLVTGGGAAQTGDNGGFNVWVRWVAGAGNTATAGLADVVLEYIASNDGSCVAVPPGGTNAGC